MKKLLLLAIGLLAAGFLARNAIAAFAVTQGVKAVTGLGVELGGMDLGLLGTRVSVKDLRVMNPAGFEDRVMIVLPELVVDSDLGALVRGQVHLEEVRVHLAELTVIKNAQGQVNLHSLTPVREQQRAGASAKPRAPAKSMPLRIDRLELAVDRVVYKDYTGPGGPSVQEFAVNIHERFEGVTSPQALASVILVRALAKTTVAQLTNLDVAALRQTAARGIQQAAQAAGAVADEALNSAVGEKGASFLKSLLSPGQAGQQRDQ